MKRYQRKKKEQKTVPIAEKTWASYRSIKPNLDIEELYCPQCGTKGEECLRVEAKVRSWRYLDSIQSRGDYFESGDDIDEETQESYVFCNHCDSDFEDIEELYEFNIEVYSFMKAFPEEDEKDIVAKMIKEKNEKDLS